MSFPGAINSTSNQPTKQPNRTNRIVCIYLYAWHYTDINYKCANGCMLAKLKIPQMQFTERLH